MDSGQLHIVTVFVGLNDVAILEKASINFLAEENIAQEIASASA